MIKSMTGFGEAAAEVDGIMYSVEIRTVNNRYLKTNLRLADTALFLTDEIERLLKNQIRRGTVNCLLNMKNVADKVLFEVDDKVLRGYIGKLRQVAEANEIECRINLADLLTLPGAVQPAAPDVEQADRIRKTVLDLVGRAIEQLKQMRSCEGRSLAEDMLKSCDVIKEKLELINQQSSQVVKQYHEKLKKRVDELLADAQLAMDADTVAREVAIFADRSDIAEEVARLGSHLNQFAQLCHSDGNGGRRLDFISQEMLREANTIGSKASNTEISQWVIDIKCEVDRLKEQVQNVE